MQFIDEAKVTVAAGNGGDGIVAWRREKYVPKGGPAGGDGGHGGTIYVEATSELSTLVEFRFKRHFAAESGKAGGTSNKSGHSGKDLVIHVPVGTLVYKSREHSNDSTMQEIFLADLAKDGERIVVAKGGRGGLGNQHFATAVRQAPRFAEKGEPGEACTLRFELRLLADAGIVGVPNAGKSTLLSVISAARPKIADYPFTTLEPQLGVVRVSDEESFVAVDVPGLIEGAHEGAGLGDQFLRHVERTRVLVHLLDGAKTFEEIQHDKGVIEKELAAWNPKLARKPMLYAVTKLDLPDARTTLDELRKLGVISVPQLHAPSVHSVRDDKVVSQVMGISSVTGEGVSELVYATWQAIKEAPLPEIETPGDVRIELTPKDAFRIERDEDSVFVIRGERIERLAAMTNFDSDEALARFERTLAKIGVEKKLRELGAQEGDVVRIADYEFTYS